MRLTHKIKDFFGKISNFASDMIKSMTGYGKGEAVLPSGKLTVEIRTLNGKNADITIKSSLLPKDKELYVRQKIADSLTRGTIDVYLSFETSASGSAKTVNRALVEEYYRQIMAVRSTLPGEADADTILSSILRLPDVVDSNKSEIIDEASWPLADAALDEALRQVNSYREKEGAALYRDVTSRVKYILELENEVEALEPERKQAVRENILKAAEDIGLKLDPQRFEQEILFYIQKLDINEEKVRLRQHCKYFMETIDSDPCPGKKLGFIIQEMGREINTTGSKANYSAIQKSVVKMKDELEKIREQSMNIL